MSNHSKRAKQFAVLSGGALVVAPMLTTGVAHASTFTVTTLADSGAGSLRDAIDSSNTNPGADTITFQAGLTGTITLASELTINGALTIVGPGTTALTVSGDDNSRAFYLNLYNEDVSISGLTITQGNEGGNGGAISASGAGLVTLDHVVVSNSLAGGYGGGVYTDATDLLLTNSTVTGNTASYGGGIYAADDSYGSVEIRDSIISENDGGLGGGGLYFDSEATLAITRSTFENNTATGGAGAEIGNHGGVTITDSTFVGNVTTGTAKFGGGLYFESAGEAGTVTISGSTFANNSTTGLGGGIGFGGGYNDVAIVNSTFSGNTALYGGGIYLAGLYDSVAFTISHTTITGNSATADDPSYNGGGGVYLSNDGWSSPGNINLNHTVVSGNTATRPGNDISALYGGFVGSWSMVGDLDGFTLGGANNLPEGDAKLGALADNGGYTKTHLPLAGSPLINAGDPAFVAPPATDQRGETRVAYGRIDVGAVEVVPELPPTGSSNGLLVGLGAALLAIGGAMHLGGRRRTQQH